MVEVLSESRPIAKKVYDCNACEWLLNQGIGNVDFTFAEYRQIVKARRQGWKIKKGQQYVKQNNKYDGRIYTFKAIPEIHEICRNNDLYDV